jgi:hypothetical protein
MTACRDRETEPGRALELWDKAVSGGFREGEISFRLRGYVDSPNTALRDPVLFRIVDYPHPLKGRDYSLWPTYDFADEIMAETTLKPSKNSFAQMFSAIFSENFLCLPYTYDSE